MRSSITWLNFAGLSFDDPFFDETVRVLGQRLERYDSDLSYQPPIEADDSLEPAGFIFHMSRCGSTLLANCLRSLDDAIVISEAQPCNAALTPYSEGLWPFDADQSAAERDRLLRVFITCLGQRLKGGERRLFFKFTSWNTVRLGIVRALWPTTPWIFLSRDPLEVMVSNLESRTGWMLLQELPKQAQALFGWHDADPARMSPEEYCARVLGQFCWTATRFKAPRDLILDYRDLNLAAVRRVLRVLNIEPTAEETARMAAQFSIYAKDGGQARKFEQDALQKRNRATDYQRKMAYKWALPAYERLHSPSRAKVI